MLLYYLNLLIITNLLQLHTRKTALQRLTARGQTTNSEDYASNFIPQITTVHYYLCVYFRDILKYY